MPDSFNHDAYKLLGSFNHDVRITGLYTNIYIFFMPCTCNKKGPYFVREADYDAYKGCGSMIMVL